MFSALLRKGPPDHRVAEVYVRLVEQSRRTEFYRDCGVPDTVDGRFDMLALHAFLVVDRLAGRGEEEADAFVQALIDHLFADMDVNLREMGVGDLSVGKKVKQMVQAFYGRVNAYREGLAAEGQSALAAALSRNVYRSSQPDTAKSAAMASYVVAAADRLEATPVADIIAARFDFGPMPVPQDLAATS